MDSKYLLIIIPFIGFLTGFIYSWIVDKKRKKRISQLNRPFNHMVTISEGTNSVKITMTGAGGGGAHFQPVDGHSIPPYGDCEPQSLPIHPPLKKESSMKVYVAYCNDRHTDPEIKVFKDREEAIAHVKTFMEEHVVHPEGIEERKVEGYLLFLGYQFESDHAFVLEEELHD